MQKLNDWVVALGFDDSKVRKGMKGLDKLMQRQGRIAERSSSNKASQETKNLSKQNQLLREQQRLRKRINQARSLGMSGLNKYTGSLAIKDPVRMAQKRLQLEGQITEAVKKQNIKVAQEQAALKAQKDRFNSDIKYQRTKERWAKQDEQQRRAASRLSNRRERMLDSLQDMNSRTSAVSSVLPQGRGASLMSRQAALGDQIKTAKSVEELNSLSNALRRVQRDTSSAIRDANRFTQEMKRQQFAARSLTQSIHNLARSYLSIYAVGAGVKAFYDIGTDFDSMRAGLLAASGDAIQADKNFQFLLQTSKDLGVNLVESSRGFNRLGVAARSAGFDAAQIQEMHLAIAESAAAFQLDRSKQSLVFLAISQMAAKGRVSLEELQRQLGDSLPTALDAMAKAYGEFIGQDVTRGELIEAVSAGKVMSQDVLPGFAKQLRISAREGGALAAAIQKVRAEQERFMTGLYENVMKSFDEVAPAFASAWRDLNQVMATSRSTFNAVGKVLAGLFKTTTFGVKMISPYINIFGAAFDNLFSKVSGFFSIINRGVEDSSGKFSSFEKVILKIGAAFKYLEAGIYYCLHALDMFSKWLAGDKDDGVMESLAKSTVSWALALLAIIPVVRLLGKMFGGILNTIKTISGYRIAKWAFDKFKGSASETAKTGATSAVKSVGKGVLPYLGPLGRILATGMVASDAYNGVTDTSTRDLLRDNFNNSPLSTGKSFEPLSFRDMFSSMFNSRSQETPVNITTQVTLDKEIVGESITPIMMRNIAGQLEAENF